MKQTQRKTPRSAQIGAGILLVAVLLVVPIGCSVAAHNAGVAYDQCIQQIALEKGHDAAQEAMENGACR